MAPTAPSGSLALNCRFRLPYGSHRTKHTNGYFKAGSGLVVRSSSIPRDEPADTHNPQLIYQNDIRRLHFPPESGTEPLPNTHDLLADTIFPGTARPRLRSRPSRFPQGCSAIASVSPTRYQHGGELARTRPISCKIAVFWNFSKKLCYRM
jgi:hypothetical protein